MGRVEGWAVQALQQPHPDMQCLCSMLCLIMDMIPAQVAVEGCCHGELDAIYSTLQALAEQDGRPIDLLICCGDFQVC